MEFQLQSDLTPRGDQEQAIAKLAKSLHAGNSHQMLVGVTGSGKTFSMANVIARLNRPTLVLSHNKTLAAQLYSEFKHFFPDNAVEYFVSYFDYYQPEAYLPRTDTYIEKDSSINDEIERLRLSSMNSLLTRDDVLVVASVSCIYSLGSPEDYEKMMFHLRVGQELEREALLRGLIDLLYERGDFDFGRGHFRVRGDVVEVVPATETQEAIRVEFFGDEVEAVCAFDPLTGKSLRDLPGYVFHPAKQFITPKEKIEKAVSAIRSELEERIAELESQNKLVEAQRLRMRTEYDVEMLLEMGFCTGIENYSRHLSGRPPGSRPYTLLDFFSEDFLLFVDESHASIPQIGGMYAGDRSRKTTLVDYGFRLPSALDNRPLRFDEFMELTHQRVYVSATPGPFELANCWVGNESYVPIEKKAVGDKPPIFPTARRISSSDQAVENFDVNRPKNSLLVEQIIRPTGLVDPKITVKPLGNQIDDTIELCRQRVNVQQRVLVTTLTKRTAEDLTDYLRDLAFRVRYLHSDIDAIERVEILRALRAGEFDILVGINLLREGLDLPEVSLVCILDADKEGYLRSETSLMQTAGRAARHVEGEVVLFADKMTGSMKSFIATTEYRRRKQLDYNERHGIVPQNVQRSLQASLHQSTEGRKVESSVVREEGELDLLQVLGELESEMVEAATRLEYERAAHLRDQIAEMRAALKLDEKSDFLAKPSKKKARYR